MPLTARTQILIILAVASTAFPAQAQTTRYVDDDAPLGGNGLTWNTAYKYLQDGLFAAAGDPTITEIRVAGGIYKPDQDEGGGVTKSDRQATFQLLDGVAVMGGYRGCPAGNCGSGDPDERDIEMFETTFDGDLNGDDIPYLTGGLACFSGDGEPYVEGCESFDTDGDGDVDAEDLGIHENSYHVVTGSGTDGSAVLDGLSITGGNANSSYPDSDGGGMYNDHGSPTLMNCTFKTNMANTGGGMANYSASNPAIIACVFQYNTSSAIYNDFSNPTLNDCVLFENERGMYNNYSSPTLTDCLFDRNSSPAGGAMFNRGGSPTAVNCRFLGNSAYRTGSGGSGKGGAVRNNSSAPLFVNCRFVANAAARHGGAVYNSYGSSPTLIDCILSGNTAWVGGGMYIWESSATVTNCLLSGNHASHEYGGGGMANYDGYPVVTNSTIADNHANSGRGGGIANYWSSLPTLENCIVWGNTALTSSQIYASATVRFSCVEGGWSGTGNIDADPFFADADGVDNIPGTEDDNLRLLPSSPCIDAGDDTAVPLDTVDLDGDGDTSERTPLDLDGKPRFMDDPDTADTGIPDPPDYLAVVDMGAYEFVQIPGDLDWNGQVDGCDFAVFLAAWGRCSGDPAFNPDADYDGDGCITIVDYQTWLQYYRDFIGDPLAPPPVGRLGDFDWDDDLDLADFASLQTCMSEFGGSSLPCVVKFDFNQDQEVDLLDVTHFVESLTGL